MSRSNLSIRVSKWTGNGVDNTNITGIGHRPMFMLTKGSGAGVWRSHRMQRDVTNLLTTTTSGQADMLQEFLADGVQLGSSARVNTNGTPYYSISISWNTSQQYAYAGTYMGDGVDSRNITATGLSFPADFLMLQSTTTGTSSTVYRTSSMSGDVSGKFDAATTTNQVQSLLANGFQTGTAAGVNTSGLYYQFMALRALPGVIAVGSFTGNGTTQSISGVGFPPKAVIVKNGNASDQARFYTADMVTDGTTSQYFGTTATDANGVTSLDANGFTVGSSASVNGSGNTIYWIALNEGDFSAPITRRAV